MFKKFFRAHHHKIIIGAPIIFVLLISASSSGLIGTGNVLRMVIENNGQFAEKGDKLRVLLNFHTKDQFNAIGGVLSFPPDLLQVDSVERNVSAIDLWAQDPIYSNTEGTVMFSGGTLKHAVKDGTIFAINFRAIQSGRAFIVVKNAEILASDGKGTDIFTGSNILSISIRPTKTPSPDVNSDGILDINDLMLLYRKTFQSYDKRYDLDVNGTVNWDDVKLLIAEF